eukprot:6796013-Prymnesium_polylepis.1
MLRRGAAEEASRRVVMPRRLLMPRGVWRAHLLAHGRIARRRASYAVRVEQRLVEHLRPGECAAQRRSARR